MRSGCAPANRRRKAVHETERAVRGGADNSGGFDWMAYMAPSMAVLFLMFTVSLGGRSILAERQWGTLQRLLISPSSAAQVLGGKVSGIFLTGLAQMVILIAFSALAFGVRWGAPVALIVLIVATVFAATGWGALIAAYAKSPGQAMSIGSMMALVFAGWPATLCRARIIREWLQTLSLVTPNAWALEGFEVAGVGRRIGRSAAAGRGVDDHGRGVVCRVDGAVPAAISVGSRSFFMVARCGDHRAPTGWLI